MNRLWVRLTFAFIAITLAGVAAVALLANATATTSFKDYLSRQEMLNQSGIVDTLAAYYRANGNWDGVANVLDSTASGSMGRGRGQGRGGPSAILADANGLIVYGTGTGASLGSAERAGALPVTVDGATVGYLALSTPGRLILDQAQQAFLDQLSRNLLVAALVAGALAIVLGLFISKALTTPLSAMARAARAFDGHDWSHRVEPCGTQEVAEVALALNEMAASLQQAENLRRDMVADIAHELRSPVTVIQGNLHAMLDGVYPLEQAEIATIYDETRLLNRLIDDLRELALAEAGQLQLSLRAVDSAEWIQSTTAHFNAAADSQGIKLVLDLPAALPQIRADPDRLAQVLRNLISNALRYTPQEGQVKVTASVAQPDFLKVSVSDTGTGIAAEDLPQVFDRFYRGDKSRSRSSGGTGLGLAIARTIVEAMGGRIGVESAAGQGSCFWFTVPLARAD